MRKNIFILGPVASGKNTLMERIISDNADVIALDTGQIYRFISFKVYSYLKDEIDINKILDKDQDEINKLIQNIYHLTNYCSKVLSNLTFNGKNIYENNAEISENVLYSKETNALLPIVAKIPILRNKITQCINKNILHSKKPIIMTGHNIKEIDTTKFIVVYLDVSKKSSAYRLYNRNKNAYDDILDAYDEVCMRNTVDKIEYTRKNMPCLYQYIYINTDGKDIEDIYTEFVEQEKMIEAKEEEYLKLQESSINRNEFVWIFNVILQPLKNILEIMSEEIIVKYPFINKNDLIYQTLILLTSYDITDLYNCSEEYANALQESVINRDIKVYEEFVTIISKNEELVNKELLFKTLLLATQKLQILYAEPSIRKIMVKYNKNNGKSTLKTQNGLMIKNQNGISEEKIEFRRMDPQMSKFISKYCHYLHTPREDELVSYGAFINDEQYPIAYVSFSKQDRDYKKQLIHGLGIEPQNTIEMTRAWCSDSSPINIMSSLFQYSINDIANIWKEKCIEGVEDKYLQAITTAINPNLGFRASSFLGCNFIPIALRPARFTFVENDGIIEYNTRRKIQSNCSESLYFENKFNILPLNELILCIDKTKEEIVENSNILLIDKFNYETVLRKEDGKSEKTYGKNSDCD